MKKSHIAAALALTSCMVVGAAAVNGLPQSVTATFRPDVTLQVNGTAYTIRDTNGNEVAPLLYNGTTYVPLATLGQALGVQVSWDAATQTVVVTDQGGQAASSSYIGEAKAKEIALQHAGLSSAQASFLRTHLDWEDGRPVYEVEFYSGNTEYDYEIDAQTGTIRSYDFDIENYVIPSTGGSTEGLIGESRAKEIALQHAGLSSGQVTFFRTQMDWENGRRVYEVEFYSGNTEYDYEIDAATGDILSYDYDVENYTIPSGPQTGDLIGESRAREIALQHAGLSSNQVTFILAKLDWDDGRRVYDVEFYSGNKEYDYEIDATSGAVLSYDFDAEHYTAPSGNQSGNYISQEKAAQLAQDRAPNATLIKIQFEFDDGRAVYEGELREGRTEYEFEIDATTGNFIQWEQDWD